MPPNTFDEKNSRFWQHPVAVRTDERHEWTVAQSGVKNLPGWDQSAEILKAGYGVFREAGWPREADVNGATVAAFHRRLLIMKSKIDAYCPDLDEPVRRGLASRSR